MKALKTAVIGVGGMGQGHCRGLAKMEEMKLTAVVDNHRDTAAKVGKEFRVPFFTDHRALLKAGLCEAAIVVTPHPHHARPTMDCLNAGIHVLCEKPLTERISTALEMVKLAKRKKLTLGVNFPLRVQPKNAKLIEIMKAGILGKLYRAQLILPEYRTQAYYNSGSWRATWKGEGGGVLLNQAPHMIDLFLQLTGSPVEVYGLNSRRVHDIEVENTAQALMKFPDGGFGYFYTSTFETAPGKRMELVGDRGKLIVEDNDVRFFLYEESLEKMTLDTDGVWQQVKPKRVPFKLPKKAPPTIHQNFARHILYGEELICAGESGLLSLEFANALALSSEKGQWLKLPINPKAYDEFLLEKQRTSTFVKKKVREARVTDPRTIAKSKPNL